MSMNEVQFPALKRALKQIVRRLLTVGPLRFALLFLMTAVLVSVAIVLTIDVLWNGCCNAELEFAGIVTPFLDALFLVVFINAMFGEIRSEAASRMAVEAQLSKANEDLEAKIQERTRQLLEAQEGQLRKEKLALLGQVADTVGHELRNPLGVMNNAVYYLKAVLTGADDTTQEYLDIVKEEIDNAERIVSDLLDAVRTKPPHPEAVDIAQLLEQTLHKCGIPPSVTVSLDIPATVALVRADPKHLHQIFWNLITNSVEAMPEGGALTIRAVDDQAAHALHVSVQDSGTGMTPEQQLKLFQPLFTTKMRRIGLGLVVVKNLSQLNGGDVTVQTKAGAGSTFTVTLPGVV